MRLNNGLLHFCLHPCMFPLGIRHRLVTSLGTKCKSNIVLHLLVALGTATCDGVFPHTFPPCQLHGRLVTYIPNICFIYVTYVSKWHIKSVSA